MPEESIHSADIEEGDTYHQNSFKEYYGLPETTKLIFYKKTIGMKAIKVRHSR